MLEPFENNNTEEGNVKMDREVLNSMMKSWLVPRATGILHVPDTKNLENVKNSPNYQSADGKRPKNL